VALGAETNPAGRKRGRPGGHGRFNSLGNVLQLLLRMDLSLLLLLQQLVGQLGEGGDQHLHPLHEALVELQILQLKYLVRGISIGGYSVGFIQQEPHPH